MTAPTSHGTLPHTASDTEPDATPVVLWDVDGVLNPDRPTPAHRAHVYDGPGPDGRHVTGPVHLDPRHGEWMAELTAAGAAHAWATSWGRLAAGWIAPRLHPPAEHWPVVDVGVVGGIAFGRTRKAGPVARFLGPDRPAFWLDDLFGGKDPHWAAHRTARGVPTVLRPVTSPAGLTRADVDAALAWLAGGRAVPDLSSPGG
ncbi:hypothetical protein [Saccharothrix sp. HUAS TT1]|uniref:hypothetical protein n=1 Tax=unclassified Saccharothrix TaxID=2593673 RepID=UPI00345C5BEA